MGLIIPTDQLLAWVRLANQISDPIRRKEVQFRCYLGNLGKAALVFSQSSNIKSGSKGKGGNPLISGIHNRDFSAVDATILQGPIPYLVYVIPTTKYRF